MTSSTLSGAQRNDPTVPEQIGKYVVVKRVGRGSSGTVYVRTEAKKDDGREILDFVRWVIVAKPGERDRPARD